MWRSGGWLFASRRHRLRADVDVPVGVDADASQAVAEQFTAGACSEGTQKAKVITCVSEAGE